MTTVTVLPAKQKTPTFVDAQNVARLFVERHGVSQVLLYGSVVSGLARPESDIDLVAVYDNLDCNTRFDKKAELERSAVDHAGVVVDVFVTARTEWQHRSERVANSFEAGIRPAACVLEDCKTVMSGTKEESDMPMSDQEEVILKLADMRKAIREVAYKQEAGKGEQNSTYSATARLDRLVSVCANGGMVCEHGIKALVALGGQPPPHTHNLVHLASLISSEFSDCYRSVEPALLDQSARWRQAGSYTSVLETFELSDTQLLDFAEAYSDMAGPFAREVVEAYLSKYDPIGNECDQLLDVCVMLDTERGKFDLWSGLERSSAKLNEPLKDMLPERLVPVSGDQDKHFFTKSVCQHVGARSKKRCCLKQGHRGSHRYL